MSLFIRHRGYFVVIGCLVIGTMFTTLSGIVNYNHDLVSQLSSAVTPTNFHAKTVKQTHNPPQEISTSPVVNNAATNGVVHSQSAPHYAQQVTPDTSQNSSLNTQNSTIPITNIHATLEIDNQSVGVVTVTNKSNECDLLNEAYSQGLLSELTMRYSSQFGTEGVYSINGMGDPSTIWWTYTVNGKSPPYGCAYVQVKDGETVNWQYIKN